MKKIAMWLTAAALAGMLAGCSSQQAAQTEAAPSAETQAQTEAAAEETEAVQETETEAAQTEAEETEAPEPVEIRVAYHPNFGGNNLYITAEKNGFFEEEGLIVEPVQFTAGPQEVAAMVAGDVDIGYIGHGATFLAVQRQVNVFLTEFLGNGDEILTYTDTGITTLEGLKGKTIATAPGTSGETVLNLALEKAGLTSEDVNIVNMDAAGMVAAIVGKKVDACTLWPPQTTEVRKAMGEENIVSLATIGDFRDQFAFPGHWVVTPKFMDENPDIMVRFCRAMLKAMDYRKEHPDETAANVAEFIDAPLDGVTEEMNRIDLFDADYCYQVMTDGTAAKWYDALQNLYVKDGSVEKTVPVEEWFRPEFAKEAYESMQK